LRACLGAHLIQARENDVVARNILIGVLGISDVAFNIVDGCLRARWLSRCRRFEKERADAYLAAER